MIDYFYRAMAWMTLGVFVGGFGAGTAGVLGVWWVWVVVIGVVGLSLVMFSINLQKELKD